MLALWYLLTARGANPSATHTGVERARAREYSGAMTTRRPPVGLADLDTSRFALQELPA